MFDKSATESESKSESVYRIEVNAFAGVKFCEDQVNYGFAALRVDS